MTIEGEVSYYDSGKIEPFNTDNERGFVHMILPRRVYLRVSSEFGSHRVFMSGSEGEELKGKLEVKKLDKFGDPLITTTRHQGGIIAEELSVGESVTINAAVGYQINAKRTK